MHDHRARVTRWGREREKGRARKGIHAKRGRAGDGLEGAARALVCRIVALNISPPWRIGYRLRSPRFPPVRCPPQSRRRPTLRFSPSSLMTPLRCRREGFFLRCFVYINDDAGACACVAWVDVTRAPDSAHALVMYVTYPRGIALRQHARAKDVCGAVRL